MYYVGLLLKCHCLNFSKKNLLFGATFSKINPFLVPLFEIFNGNPAHDNKVSMKDNMWFCRSTRPSDEV